MQPLKTGDSRLYGFDGYNPRNAEHRWRLRNYRMQCQDDTSHVDVETDLVIIRVRGGRYD